MVLILRIIGGSPFLLRFLLDLIESPMAVNNGKTTVLLQLESAKMGR